MAKWAIIGGDNRQIAMCEALRKKKISVSAWGLGDASTETDWNRTVKDADAVILPLPATEDNVRIRCPLHDGVGMRFSSLLSEVGNKAVICGGKMPQRWVEQAADVGIRVYDYFLSEYLQMQNALPTVEAALYLAMQALPVTLDGCHAAVLGYGRIASLLCERLYVLGANVTVYARKERDLAHAKLRHFHPVPLIGNDETSSLTQLPHDCRIVFNTIPHQIVTRAVLSYWRRDCVLMDLASFPGGFDTLAATELSFPLILASALPGKHFPETAGNIIAETLSAQMNQLI